ncbi:MAG: RNA replicase beta chain [Sanya solspi-like virus 1]|nr:MAG: RNA replicase beta chain [Sanya solspi-like virus 1]UUW21145.1 MAG: RNA replicase beta chain [Sanya solspi-like virus 1]
MLHAKKESLRLTKLSTGPSLWGKTLLRLIDLMDVYGSVKVELTTLVEQGRFVTLIEHLEALADQNRSNSPDTYLSVAQVLAFVKKYKAIPTLTEPVDPLHKATSTWREAEESCRRFNNELLHPDRETHEFLVKMKAWITRVIGFKPDFDEIYQTCKFTHGASLAVHGDKTHMPRKYTSDVWTCTPSAAKYVPEALSYSRFVRDNRFVCDLDAPYTIDECLGKLRFVRGNKLSFVPKTILTDRPIAVEPLMNSYLQAGIDGVMRELLRKRAHINLQYQSVNQEYARRGSIDGSYSTIDLSSASDTLCTSLVRQVLPHAWYVLLRDVRSPYSFVSTEDANVELEKFCSMGNGFCFPLQTLIFAAICKACGAVDRDFTVYGDDIIVRSDLAENVLLWLRKLGFTPNGRKTYLTGDFRESCGTDWKSGVRVRPAYAVNDWSDVRNVMSFHNTALQVLGPRYYPLLRWLRNQVPVHQRFLRPVTDRDGNAFNVELDEAVACRYVKWDRTLYAWRWKEFISFTCQDRTVYPDAARHADRLSILSGSTEGETRALRRKTRTSTRLTSRWSIVADYLDDNERAWMSRIFSR